MKTCEWKDCDDLATHTLTLIRHSGIYAGLYEVRNTTQTFKLCQKHRDKAEKMK